MALDARNRDNVLVPSPNVNSGGGVHIGDVVTDVEKFPKDATTAIDAAFKTVAAGFIGEEGITKTVDRQTEKIKDSNKDVVVVLENSHDVTVKLTFQESKNAGVLKAIYGEDNVVQEGDKITVVDRAGATGYHSFVFEMFSGEGRHVRAFIPNGQITNVGDIALMKKEDIIKYEVTIECLTDPKNAKFYTFFG